MNLYRANSGMESLVPNGLLANIIVSISHEIPKKHEYWEENINQDYCICYALLIHYTKTRFSSRKDGPDLISIIDQSPTDTLQIALSLL